jgi:hypothetical protein
VISACSFSLKQDLARTDLRGFLTVVWPRNLPRVGAQVNVPKIGTVTEHYGRGLRAEPASGYELLRRRFNVKPAAVSRPAHRSRQVVFSLQFP